MNQKPHTESQKCESKQSRDYQIGDLIGLPGVVEGADLIGVEGDDVAFIVAVIGAVRSDEGGAATG